MKLLKPSWVNHDDKPIFSVDIHPTGKRFATGGQGGDSGRVVVWNLNSVLYESVEVDPNIPKMLCQMDNHLACVNCVRWSNGGKYLASGGDDRLVMVWGLSVATGGAGKHKAETWRCLSTLRGHAGDVLDLAWSPLDKWLASCSVDNTIIIWNAEKFPEMVCVLNGHTGLVKGVAWDPVGKYLASQSDDKSLRVWKTADWAPETVITEPFEECGGTTHVLRLSWSPDGQYVLSAHAMNGGGPTAQVVERDGWRCDKDFVGHRKAVTCARFNNNIFVKEGKKCCCAAVGSRDRALSIWLTSLKRPLVVIHDLFGDSVLDLSWSSDGLNLLACSSDGTVACIQFTNKEIGTPLTSDEKNAFYEKIYGKCLANESGDLSSNLLVECPEILLAREKHEAKKEAVKDDATPRNDKSQTKPMLTTSPVSANASISPSGAPLRPMDRQIETRTSDGKRRITPVFIPLTNADANESLGSQPSGTENCFSTSSQSKSRIRVERRDDIVIHPNVSNHATSAPAPKPSDNALDQRLRKRGPPPLPGPRAADFPCKRAAPSPPPPPAAAPLPAPRLGANGPVVRAAGALRLQVVNKACNTHYGALSKIQLLPNNSASPDPVWETYLGSTVTCIACCARWAALACADGSLHAWRIQLTHATRALPPIALLSQAAKLTLSGDTLVAVTTHAELTMWDLATATCLVRPLSFRNLLTHGVTVTNCALLEDGNPMISLSNGKSYIYSKKLFAWVIWADVGDPVWRACSGQAATRAPRAALALYPAPRPAGPAPAPASYSTGAARSWLESQVASCLHLRLAKDYKHWIISLFGHLVNHGTEEQLRTILDDMMGPSHCTSTPKKWQSTVLGFKKHDLLEEMLSLLVRHLRWQRIYTEYSEQLTDIKEANLNGSTMETETIVNGH
ncbi:LOW QUALITY PROTEIN: protein HIRA homolog [Hyposmocoma kahamanoa]|uniref:LOW QUALITY PROTEIN: protein HIRA homolog n=1 Tax=Hyposmocoma kahamanoa TaxID=1477025 RepID=UPI000E6D7761|nr:LOW QUALITY PROTEIN: protein HIRA homolog [Hyposmocoma kahamanoa]